MRISTTFARITLAALVLGLLALPNTASVIC